MSGKPKHGLSRTAEYRAWQTMRQRCLNPGHAAFPAYGGRGITVCDRWRNSVEAFVADMGPKPSARHELDRIDNDGPYSPGNCRWVLRTVNSRNRRSNRRLRIGDETRTLAEWCEQIGMPRDTVRKRLVAGWSVETALFTPVRPKPGKPPRTCGDCGASGIHGQRCRSCENRRRWRGGVYARHEQQISEVA